MKNLIKSYLYQLKINRLAYVIFLVMALLNCTFFLGEYAYVGGEITTGKYIVGEYGFFVFSIAISYSVMIVGIVCCMDFIDKTSNYDIMSGHTRREIYFSKVFVSILFGIIGFILICMAPLVLSSILVGFGNEVALKEVLKRFIIAIFPAIRIICEFIFLSFLIRNPYIIMGIGTLLFMLSEMLPTFASNPKSSLLGFTCFNNLALYESWYSYTLQDTVNLIHVYGRIITVREAFSMISVSVLVSVFFLVMGYFFYNRDDLR